MTKPRQQPSLPPLPRTARDRAVIIERSKWLANVERLEANVVESPLRALEYLGAITAKQREAGEAFEADCRLTAHCSTRDSLDMTPCGEAWESPEAAEAKVRAKARLRKVKTVAGPLYASLRHVTVERRPLKMGAVILPRLLDMVGEIYGLTKGAKA